MRSINFTQFTKWEPAQYSIDYIDYMIDLSKDYPPVEFLLNYKGVGCFPRGDIQAITGKMKSGKSFACTCIMTALLKGEFMGFKANEEQIKILHIDTEQGISNVVERTKVLHKLCGWHTDQSNERYRVATLRGCSAKQRLEVLKSMIGTFKPDFILLDGIRDLLLDFNEVGDSAALVGELMKISRESNAAITCILHENKGDQNMRGHLGTELGNKSSEVYSVSRDKNSGKIEVDQSVSRNAPLYKWVFFIEDGIPIPAEYQDPKQTLLEERFKIIFGNNEALSNGELVAGYTKIAALKERTAQSHIKEAVETGILCKEGNRYHYLFPPVDSDE